MTTLYGRGFGNKFCAKIRPPQLRGFLYVPIQDFGICKHFEAQTLRSGFTFDAKTLDLRCTSPPLCTWDGRFVTGSWHFEAQTLRLGFMFDAHILDSCMGTYKNPRSRIFAQNLFANALLESVVINTF